MALNIRNERTEALASELAALTGETKTEAITQAIAARLASLKKQQQRSHLLADELDEIALHCASLPVLDDRNAEAMLYDENGLPK